MGDKQYLVKCLVLSCFILGIQSLQCPVCNHVTVSDVPSIIKSTVNAVLGAFQDVECSQELRGPTPKIREETCQVQPGKVARCSWYSGTLTMKLDLHLVSTEIPFQVHTRGCYYAPAASVPSNGCHDLRNLNEDKSAFQKILKDLSSVLNLYSFIGQRCLCSDTYCVSMGSLCSQVSLNIVAGSILIVLMFKYL